MQNKPLDHTDAPNLSTQEWWDTAHKQDALLYLSGYPGPDIWKRLEIEDRIVPGATVLNIGVGMGHCTRALHEKGCVLHAHDISPDALAKVKDIATTWLPADLDRLPANTFDTAISHLVAQHMLDDPLRAQLRAVIRSLKPDGIFAMQFADRILQPPPDWGTDYAAKLGGMTRTQEHMAQLITEAGGRPVRFASKDSGDSPSGKWAWKIVHISRPY